VEQEEPMTKQEGKGFSITINLKVPIQNVQNQLCAAFEGGSNYWVEIGKMKKPVAFLHKFDAKKTYPHIDYPINPGGKLFLLEVEEKKEHVLSMVEITKGVQIMAEKYPKHFSDMITDNDDATTGDVFLQCCLFGEIKYG
jgi:hypothetical protein